MIKKRYLLLILILFLSISTVNSHEIDNSTYDNQELNEFDSFNCDNISVSDSNTNEKSFWELKLIIDEAKEGSTINLQHDYGGGYANDIIINKSININGNNHKISSTFKLVINSNNVSLKNIYFESGGIQWFGYNGFLENCTFYNIFHPISWNGENGFITNCKFNNNNRPIYWSGDYGVITGCIFNNSILNPNCNVIHWEGSYGILNDCFFYQNNLKFYSDYNTYSVYCIGSNVVLNNLKFKSNYVGNYYSLYWGGKNGYLINCDFNGYNQQYIRLGVYFYNNDVSEYTSNNLKDLNVDNNKIKIYFQKLNVSQNSQATFEINAYNSFSQKVQIDYIYTYFNKLEKYSVENNKVTINLPNNFLERNPQIPILVVIKDLNMFKLSRIQVVSEILLNYEVDDEDDIVTIFANKNINSKAIVKVNGSKFNEKFNNGVLILDYLFFRGKNVFEIELDDSIYKGYLKFNTTFKNGVVHPSDILELSGKNVESYYTNCEYTVKLVDIHGNVKPNKNITFTINGKDYIRKTDSLGFASININLLPGEYKIYVDYSEKDNYVVMPIENTIKILSTIEGKDITKIYKNSTKYYAKFIDKNGNLLKNTEVVFNINGVMYKKNTNNDGVASLNINLIPGKYIITSRNPITNQQFCNNIEVLSSIVENHDLTKYYKNDSQYVIKILGDDGKPVGSGKKVTFNINGVFYTKFTNDSGNVKLNINLAPGTYIITAEYNGFKVSNKIKVLSVLSANNLTMRYEDGSQFKVKLLDGKGNPYSNQKIVLNVNGVFYEKKTNDEGIAKLNINLRPGTYTITSSFNGLNVANRITIFKKSIPSSSSNIKVTTNLCLSNLQKSAVTEIWIYTGSSSNYYATKTDFLGRASVKISETINEVHKIDIKTSYTGLYYNIYSGEMTIVDGRYVTSNVYLVYESNPNEISLSDIIISVK